MQAADSGEFERDLQPANKVTGSSSRSRESLIENLDDPFLESDRVASKRSDSVKRARAHSVAESSKHVSARPPSITSSPVPRGPVHYGHVSHENTSKEEKTRHRRMKSLDLDKKEDVDGDSTGGGKPIKAKSVHELTAVSIHSPKLSTFEVFDFCAGLPAGGETESPKVSPLPSMQMIPIAATSNPQGPVIMGCTGSSYYSGASQEEFQDLKQRFNDLENKTHERFTAIECRLAQNEESQHTLVRSVKSLAQAQSIHPKCTQMTISIPNIDQSMTVAKNERFAFINSAPFYTNEEFGGGYKMCVRAYLKGNGQGKETHLSLFLVLMKGKYDHLKELAWPFNRKVTFKLINHAMGGKDIVESFDPGLRRRNAAFQRPKSDMNIPTGFPRFVHHNILFHGGYIENDSISIQVIVHPEFDDFLSQPPEHCSDK